MTLLEKLGAGVVVCMGLIVAAVTWLHFHDEGIRTQERLACVARSTTATLAVALAQQRTLIAQAQTQIAEATARAQVEATRIATGETIVTQVIHDSPSAASCRLDDVAAAGVNGLH